jgi:hypothetical protein
MQRFGSFSIHEYIYTYNPQSRKFILALFESKAAGEVFIFYRETKALAEGEAIGKASVRRARCCDAANMSNGGEIVGIEGCCERGAVKR